jgi:hypothetical protein
MWFMDKVHFPHSNYIINKQNTREQATDNQHEMTETQLRL